MSEVIDEIEKFRAVLKEYDDGLSSPIQCVADFHAIVMGPFLAGLESGETIRTMSSCCCASHPPTRTFEVRFHIEPHGYMAERIP